MPDSQFQVPTRHPKYGDVLYVEDAAISAYKLCAYYVRVGRGYKLTIPAYRVFTVAGDGLEPTTYMDAQPDVDLPSHSNADEDHSSNMFNSRYDGNS